MRSSDSDVNMAHD